MFRCIRWNFNCTQHCKALPGGAGWLGGLELHPGARWPRFKSQFPNLQALWFWPSDLGALTPSLRFSRKQILRSTNLTGDALGIITGGWGEGKGSSTGWGRSWAVMQAQQRPQPTPCRVVPNCHEEASLSHPCADQSLAHPRRKWDTGSVSCL